MDRYHWFGRAGRHAVVQAVHASIPAALIVVFAAIVIVSLFDLEDHGVAVVGNIPAGNSVARASSKFTSTTSLRSFPGACGRGDRIYRVQHGLRAILRTSTNTTSIQIKSWSPSAPPISFRASLKDHHRRWRQFGNRPPTIALAPKHK